MEKLRIAATDKVSGQTPLSQNKLIWERKKELEKQMRKIQNQIAKTEEEISQTEERQKEIEKLLENPLSIADNSSYNILYAEYNTLKKQQKELLDVWAIRHEELDVLQKELNSF